MRPVIILSVMSEPQTVENCDFIPITSPSNLDASLSLMRLQKKTGKCSRTDRLMRFPVLPAAVAAAAQVTCPPESLSHDRSALLLPVVAEARCEERHEKTT